MYVFYALKGSMEKENKSYLCAYISYILSYEYMHASKQGFLIQ